MASYRVENGHLEPHSAVVYIEVEFESGAVMTGSGVIVGKNDILTAAHVFFSADQGDATKITVYSNYEPGGSNVPIAQLFQPEHGHWAPFAQIPGDRLITSGDGSYPTMVGSELDLLVLGVSVDLSDYGMMWVDPIHSRLNAYVTGYPGIYGRNLIEDYGVVSDHRDDNLIDISALDINPGNSGGPIWHYDGEFASVLGVVSTAYYATDVDQLFAGIEAAMEENDFFLGEPTGRVWFGRASAETIHGYDGADLINGDKYADTIFGHAGDDTLRGGRGVYTDKIDGGDGFDYIFGEDGDDILEGNSDSDYLVGGNGNDKLYGHLNSDFSDDGAADLLDGKAGNDFLYGNDGDDILYGWTGNDQLFGGAGKDKLYGEEGKDRLAGGAGDDEYYQVDGSDTIVELAGEGYDIVYAVGSATIAANVEELRVGYNANAIGNAENNVLVGGDGDNILDGRGGADTMSGGHGNDIYIVDNVGDLVYDGIRLPFVNAGFDEVRSSVDFKISDQIEMLTLTGKANINGTGSAIDNIITGNAGANILKGEGGNDTLDGGGGADDLRGGAGDDVYIFDNIGDTATEASNEGTDTIQTSVAIGVLTANIENLVLTGKAALSGYGNSGSNDILGNGAANKIDGGSGNDRLDGGRGNDILTGGTGADKFAFGPASGADIITDFILGEDLIDLRNLGSISTLNDIKIVQKGLDTSITLSAGNTILLKDVDANDLDMSDFIFARGDTSYFTALDEAFEVFDPHYIPDGSPPPGGWNINPEAHGDLFKPTVVVGNTAGGNQYFSIFYGMDAEKGDLEEDRDFYFYNIRHSAFKFNADDVETTHLQQSGIESSIWAVGDNLFVDFDIADAYGSYFSYVYSSRPDETWPLLSGSVEIDGYLNRPVEGLYHSIDRVSDGKYVVTWTSDAPLFTAPGDPYPLTDGDYNGIVYAFVDKNGVSTPTVVNSATTGEQLYSEVDAASDGSFVITWLNWNDNTVRAQRYNSSGTKAGTEFTVNSQVQTRAYDTDVVFLDNGNFLVYWFSLGHAAFGSGAQQGILGRLYASNGTALGAEFLLATNPDTDEGTASVAALEDGRFVAAWTEIPENPGGNGWDIKVQVFDATGQRVHDEYIVNTPLSGNQHSPSVAYLGNDTIVVAWEMDGATANDRSTVWGQVLKIGENTGGGSNPGVDLESTLQKVAKGSGGADKIFTNRDNQIIDGGAGNDLLAGGAGADTILGGDGIDTVTYEGSSGAVTIDLTAETQKGGDAQGDMLSGIENVTGSMFADVLSGTALSNVLNGLDGDDRLVGLGGADKISGGNGIDEVNYAASAKAVTINLATSLQSGGDAQGDKLSLIENVVGSDFDDVLKGSAVVNVITGGKGDDKLEGGAGADTLDGGEGTDTASYAGSKIGVTVNLGLAGVQVSRGDASGDKLTGIENIVGSGLADTITGDGNANVIDGGAGIDTISGGDGNDSLYGGAGNDVLAGGTGNDLLDGGIGADQIDGGDGIDTLSYASSKTGIGIILGWGGANADYAVRGAAGDLIKNIENVVGTNAADSITGNELANLLMGGAGNDFLMGFGGADTLNGGDGSDTASYETDDKAVTIDLRTGEIISTGDANGDVLLSIENIIGTTFADKIIGDANNNKIEGVGGDDLIEGGIGNDILIGGTHDAGGDTVSYANASSAVTVNLSKTTAQDTKGAGKDTISGFENVIGSAFGDLLTGDKFANVLNGGGGNDTLIGGAGNDTLTGGSGMDFFVFASSSGIDTVTDYTAGQDRFDLRGVAGLTTWAQLEAKMAEADGDVEIIFNATTKLIIENTTITSLQANLGDFLLN